LWFCENEPSWPPVRWTELGAEAVEFIGEMAGASAGEGRATWDKVSAESQTGDGKKDRRF
jgi:hypothetical protein